MKIGTHSGGVCPVGLDGPCAERRPKRDQTPTRNCLQGSSDGPPQTVVLFGDPTKPGVFVSRVKFSAGWKDPPHWHPDTVRTAVVLSGTLYFASGDKWDETKFTAYPPGTFYSEPSKAPHYTWAKDGEVIIQVTGVGPSGKTPVAQ